MLEIDVIMTKKFLEDSCSTCNLTCNNKFTDVANVIVLRTFEYMNNYDYMWLMI